MATKRISQTALVDEETGEILAATPEWPADIATVPVGPNTLFFKTPYNHDTNKETDRTALFCPEKTKTQQHLAEEQELKTILNKFITSGGDIMALPRPDASNYLDTTDMAIDMQSRMVTAHEVEEAWNKLTPEQRSALKDPQTMVAYVDHCLEVGDVEPLIKLGLGGAIEPIPTPAPVPAPQAAPEAPKPPTPTGGTPAPVPAATAPTGP